MIEEKDMQCCPTLEKLAIDLHEVREKLNLSTANLRYARKKVALLEQQLNLAHELIKKKDLEIAVLEKKR
jgi:hypothetical protein